MVHEESSEDLKTKSKRALKAILAKGTDLLALHRCCATRRSRCSFTSHYRCRCCVNMTTGMDKK